MKLLLIDSRVPEKQTFIDSRAPEVDYHVFDYATDTYATLTSAIVAKGQFADIALVQHTDMILGVKILLSETRCDTLNTTDSAPFDTLKNFLMGLKQQAGLARFDFLGCAMYDATIMPIIFQAIETELGIDLRASTDFTGNAPDGNWILESDNVDIKNTYFTEAISAYKGVLAIAGTTGAFYMNHVLYDVSRNIIYRHKDIYGRPIGPLYDASGFNLKFPESKFIAQGGDWTSTIIESTQTNIVSVVIADGHFGIQSDGKIVNLGTGGNAGGFPTGAANSDFVGLYSSNSAYTGLRHDGSVFLWGHWSVTDNANVPTVSGFIQIVTSNAGFAGLHSNGTIYTWGRYAPTFPDAPAGSYYTAIYANDFAYAALTNLGRIMATAYTDRQGHGKNPSSTIDGYKLITPSPDGFAALHTNGSITVWGHNVGGWGEGGAVLGFPTTSDFVEIHAGINYYGARKADGTLVLWGYGHTGTTISGYVAFHPHLSLALHKDGYITNFSNGVKTTETDFVSIFSGPRAAIAIRSDGRLKAFGYADQDYAGITGVPTDGGYVYIQFVDGAIAALKNDGTITVFSGTNRSTAWRKIAPTGGNYIYLLGQGGTPHDQRFTALKTTNTSITVSDYYYSTGASKIITPPPPPPSGADAVTAAIASATVNQATITTFVAGSTKSSLQIYKELKDAIKTNNLYTTAKYNDTISATIAGLRSKIGASTIDVSYNDISGTFKNSAFTGSVSSSVTIVLPDFTAANPTAAIPDNKRFVKVEAPTATAFTITVGAVSKSFTLNLSGVESLQDTSTNAYYYLGDDILFGSTIKTIIGFGSILLEDTTVVADPTLNNVTVYIPMTYEMSGANVELFGQQYTMSGDVIVVNDTLSVASFYEAGVGAWLKYKQGDNENDFTAGPKDAAKATAIKGSIVSAVHIADGTSYDASKKGSAKLDCSGVFSGMDSTWCNYHSLQDFVLSYFANNILGHPGALAAISNDSAIRSKVTNEFPPILNEMATMAEDKCKVIVQQIMNQDLARFNLDEKNVYQPVKFRAGDKVILQLALHDNTYSLKSPAGNPSNVVGGVTGAASASASVESTPVKTSTDYYLLQFTLA